MGQAVEVSIVHSEDAFEPNSWPVRRSLNTKLVGSFELDGVAQYGWFIAPAQPIGSSLERTVLFRIVTMVTRQSFWKARLLLPKMKCKSRMSNAKIVNSIGLAFDILRSDAFKGMTSCANILETAARWSCHSSP